MKNVSSFGGILLMTAGIATFIVYQVSANTIKPSDYVNNRKKVKNLRKIEIKRIPLM